MVRKNIFVIGVIIIYLLFLGRNGLMRLATKLNGLESKSVSLGEAYLEEDIRKMRDILEIETDAYEVVFSKVVMRDIYEFFDKITILKGRDEGLEVGEVVINDKGVLGVIKRVDKSFSEVRMLTNADINLSVKINSSYGILTSKDEKIIVKNIKLDKEIREGDLVYTSGLTKVREGLLIGEVKNIWKDDLELQYILEIKPAVNFQEINYVGVVK